MQLSRALQAVCLAAFAAGVAGCHPDMWIQPKYKAQEKSEFFADNMSSRQPVRGTVPFGEKKDDDAYYRGYVDGKLVREFPVPVTRDLIERGQERFDIFCRHCHGAIGDGEGMIAQRGFKVEQTIATYHTDRLREMPVGHFFDVITNGYGVMFPFKDRIPVEDRWAIVAYVRVLQRSQNASAADLPTELKRLMNSSDSDMRDEFERLMDDPASQLPDEEDH
ncbi:MAG: cytochrome c [Armatimonadetes bacterium]|nr:cytochrome c [Armatimonadota bacterium]